MVTRDAVGRQDDVVVQIAAQSDHGPRQGHEAIGVAGGADLQLEADRRLGHLVENVQLLVQHDPRRQPLQGDKGATQRVGHLRPGGEALVGPLGHGLGQQRIDDGRHFGAQTAGDGRLEVVMVGSDGFR